MKHTCVLLVVIISVAAAGETAPIRIKVGTVPDEYTPTNASVRERVSMSDFRFEVNQETVRARLVVEYTYPDQIIYGGGDDARGPAPTIIQLPGLKYLPQAHAVVYEAGGKQTVCAQVQEHKGLLGSRLRVKNTGLCTVSAERAKHAEDDGWQIQRFTAIDTYLEVH